jgi:hypothetical protein
MRVGILLRVPFTPLRYDVDENPILAFARGSFRGSPFSSIPAKHALSSLTESITETPKRSAADTTCFSFFRKRYLFAFEIAFLI